MRIFVASLFGAFLLAAPGAHAADDGLRVATMPFEECLAIIDEVTHEIEVEPVVLTSSGDVKEVRVPAEDGFVTVKCERAGNRMTLTKAEAVTTAAIPEGAQAKD